MEVMEENQQQAPTATPTQPENQPRPGIRAFDQYGREVVVPREQWAAEILPNMLRDAWSTPDQLYGLIANSLADDFVAEVADAAHHLAETDTMPSRGACMWGIVLARTERLPEARQVLEDAAAKYPEDANVLANLATIQAAQDEVEAANATLWRALQVDPNLEHGIAWYASDAQEKGGEPAAREALERLASLPGAWRPQLYIARTELTQGNLDAAKALYEQSLKIAPKPTPGELLMQMSGDLGGAGHLADLIALTLPHFQPEVHGLPVGNNLIKALVDTGDLVRAAQLKDQLYALNRPDWRDGLAFWDAEIARRQAAASAPVVPSATVNGAIPQQQIQIGMLRVDGPVWLPANSPALPLFGGAQAKSGAPSVTFFGGSAEAPEDQQKAAQSAEGIGRLTRALPLYLAEQVEMRTAAAGRALLPWAVAAEDGSQPSGFVVSGAAWPDATAVQAVADPANKSDYVVTVHIDAEVEPWTASLAFLRSSDGSRIGELEAEFPPASPETALPRLADEVVELLASLGSRPVPRDYTIPAGPAFVPYLLRLEQLLSVRCAAMPGVSPQFLVGERAILDAGLELVLAAPQSAPARLLLVETLGAVQRVRPQAAQDFQSKFLRLVSDVPYPAVDELFRAPEPASAGPQLVRKPN